MRLSVALLTATLLTGSLAGCMSGYGVPQTSSLSTDGSAQMRFTTGRSPTANVVPPQATPGIYGVAFFGYVPSSGIIYGYPANDRSNGPPVCSVGFSRYSALHSIAVDRNGDLIVAEGGPISGTPAIVVYAGPGLCGPELGSIADPYGYPVVAAADPNVQRPKPGRERIVVGNGSNGMPASVSLCTLSGGCTTNLTNPNIYEIFGVVIARNGDCWASGYPSAYLSAQPSLVYFAHCRGHGVLATGFQNSAAGTLDIDDNGNLVSLSSPGASFSYSQLYIYSGCNPACTLVRKPFPLFGVSTSVHLDGRSKRFVAADFQYTQLDVYSYSTTGIEYEYSISIGLSAASVVLDAAFSPASKE